jgi:hypothetical protein
MKARLLTHIGIGLLLATSAVMVLNGVLASIWAADSSTVQYKSAFASRANMLGLVFLVCLIAFVVNGVMGFRAYRKFRKKAGDGGD